MQDLNDDPLPLTLMYHGITTDKAGNDLPPGREIGAELYDVPLERFKLQMHWLKDNGFTPTLLENVHRVSNPVVITFDDGEMNNFKYALPVLKEFGWKAYFFIIVKRVGRAGYMGWKEIKRLQKEGMVIGSHGLSHEILTNLLDSQMEEELKGSKKNLEINLKTPINTISIPRGFCNDKILETSRALGYETVFISQRSSGPRAASIPGVEVAIERIAVKSDWSLERFGAALQRKTPLIESVKNTVITIFKNLLHESWYNWMRGLLLKLSR